MYVCMDGWVLECSSALNNGQAHRSAASRLPISRSGCGADIGVSVEDGRHERTQIITAFFAMRGFLSH